MAVFTVWCSALFKTKGLLHDKLVSLSGWSSGQMDTLLLWYNISCHHITLHCAGYQLQWLVRKQLQWNWRHVASGVMGFRVILLAGHLCHPHHHHPDVCDYHVFVDNWSISEKNYSGWCQEKKYSPSIIKFINVCETRPRAGFRPAGPRWIVGRVHFLWVHFSRLASRLRRSARSHWTWRSCRMVEVGKVILRIRTSSALKSQKRTNKIPKTLNVFLQK